MQTQEKIDYDCIAQQSAVREDKKHSKKLSSSRRGTDLFDSNLCTGLRVRLKRLIRLHNLNKSVLSLRTGFCRACTKPVFIKIFVITFKKCKFQHSTCCF